MDERLPVLVITGFLGSGKTTLVNALLAQDAMQESAVLINEYGEVGLDGDLVAHPRDRTSVVAGGCFCCSLSANFEAEFLSVYSRAQRTSPVNSIIVEASGLADPVTFVEYVIGHPVASRLFRLEGVVCTVDALFGERQIASQPEAAAQVAIADVLLVTKPDLAVTEEIDRLELTLGGLNPRAPVEKVLNGAIAVDRLRTLRRDAGEHATLVGSPPAHSHGIESFVLRADVNLPWRTFSTWLTRVRIRWSKQLLRVKGVVYFSDNELPSAIHGVHHVFHRPVPIPHLKESGRRSRLVFIIKGADRAEIEAGWSAMLLERRERRAEPSRGSEASSARR
ncbi:MAG: GTP-binding protein [Alphaproteobacteria bacterium]|nr:GTP-binding protein [Alphaproteobacteria bacterium]